MSDILKQQLSEKDQDAIFQKFLNLRVHNGRVLYQDGTSPHFPSNLYRQPYLLAHAIQAIVEVVEREAERKVIARISRDIREQS